MIAAVCKGCHSPFTVKSKGSQRPAPQYCSRECFRKHRLPQVSAMGLANVKRFSPPNGERTCEHCRGTFIARRGARFCSLACWYSSQRGNFKTPHPSGHLKWQRKLARVIFGNKCAKCGYGKIPEILQTHHRDHNSRNAEPDNIQLLCPNCHEEEHFLSSTGRFSKKPRRRTPGTATYKQLRVAAIAALPPRH